MRFGHTVKLNRPELMVSKRHDAWLRLNDHPVYSVEALMFAVRELTKRDRVRKGTVSASALGGCGRQQQFVYLGMSKLTESQTSAAKMANGTMVHLRWQMGGLTEGWLKQAEVPIKANPLRLSGTMDGIADDDSVVEIKSINARGFAAISTFGAKHEHQYQLGTYLVVSGASRGRFIYENKDTQEYREIVLEAGQLPTEEIRKTAADLWAHIDAQELVEPLNDCLDRKGWRYDYCPFRDRCLKIKDWSEVPR